MRSTLLLAVAALASSTLAHPGFLQRTSKNETEPAQSGCSKGGCSQETKSESQTKSEAQTTLTVIAKVTHTITSCAATITNCPAGHSQATNVIVVTDTIIVDTVCVILKL